jgi:hypothetical protein
MQRLVRHSHFAFRWFGLLPEQHWDSRCQIAQYLLLSLFCIIAQLTTDTAQIFTLYFEMRFRHVKTFRKITYETWPRCLASQESSLVVQLACVIYLV